MTPSSQDVELLLHRGATPLEPQCLPKLLPQLQSPHLPSAAVGALSYRQGFEEWGQNLGLDIR